MSGSPTSRFAEPRTLLNGTSLDALADAIHFYLDDGDGSWSASDAVDCEPAGVLGGKVGRHLVQEVKGHSEKVLRNPSFSSPA